MKIREHDRVDVPPYPEITRLLAWRSSLQRSIVLASGNPDYDRVNAWIKCAMDGSKSYEELDDIGGNIFVTLDMKLANGVTNMLSKAGDEARGYATGST